MSTNILLLDANVLIDFLNSEPSLLNLVSKHIGNLYVLDQIVSEVKGLDKSECKKFGLTVIEPTNETLALAETNLYKLSYNDRLCLFTAIDSDFICVTNDKDLRQECQNNQVKILWGLELIRILVEKSVLSIDDAIKIVETIHKINRLYIPESLVKKFVKLVKKIE